MKFFISIAVFLLFIFTASPVASKGGKAKFYDFNEQIIDGEIKRPTTLYTDAREAVKFERLLSLKKSFMDDLFDTAKERVFR